MSRAAKGVQMDKVMKLFEAADLDEQIKAYHEIKGYLTKKLTERAQELEEKANKYRSTEESL